MSPAGSIGATPGAAARNSRRPFASLRRIRRNRLFVLGAIILLPVCLSAIAAPLVSPYNPRQLNMSGKLAPMSWAHPFGTDEYGRDLFTRVIYGSRISLRIGAIASLLAALIGIALGALAGYHPRLDAVISRGVDGLMNFPGIILGIMVMAALGPAEVNVILSITAMYAPRIVRVVRASVLEVKTFDFVDAARAAGLSPGRILAKHILPHTLPPVIVQVSFGFAWAILVESGLSFLGLGTPPPAPSWGNIISDGREFIRTAPWIMMFPGLLISAAVMGLNLMGDGLRDILDPRLRSTARRIETSVG